MYIYILHIRVRVFNNHNIYVCVCRYVSYVCRPNAEWLPLDGSEQVDQVMQVLGLLASTASDGDSAVRSLLDSHLQEEAVLNVSQMRIYMVPVLEYLLATDPLGVAFDLLVSGTRDTVCALPSSPLFIPYLPASDSFRLTSVL